MTKKCTTCLKETKLKKCKGCSNENQIYYCSKECQKKDLKNHKKICEFYIKKKEKKELIELHENKEMIVVSVFSNFPDLLKLLHKLSIIENTYYKPGTPANNLYSLLMMDVKGIGKIFSYIFEKKYKDEFVKLLDGTNICLSHKSLTYITSDDLIKNPDIRRQFKIKEEIKKELGVDVKNVFWIEEGQQNERFNNEEVVFGFDKGGKVENIVNDFMKEFPKTTKAFIKKL